MNKKKIIIIYSKLNTCLIFFKQIQKITILDILFFSISKTILVLKNKILPHRDWFGKISYLNYITLKYIYWFLKLIIERKLKEWIRLAGFSSVYHLT